ncbi:MAG: class I SAM-dependent methyltransferase [Candidatus Aenigmarchaeota archaeon]|nr:class I SAM-dependent methyltransferase [Candidatus Aenigmarchaeota archaeon]
MRFKDYSGKFPVTRVDAEEFLGVRYDELVQLGSMRSRQIVPIDPRYGGICMVTADPDSTTEHIAAYYDFLAETHLVDHIKSRFDPWVPETVSKLVIGERVVDIGCCDGRYTVYYALNHPTKQFVGIDLSEKSLDLASERARKYCVKNVTWLPGNIRYVQFPETDTFVLNNVAHELYGAASVAPHLCALDDFGEFVNPGGRVIVSQEFCIPGQAVVDIIHSTADGIVGFKLHTVEFREQDGNGVYVASFDKVR